MGFNDSAWAEGRSGFGVGAGGKAVIRTAWSSADIWMRTTFTLASTSPSDLSLRLFHDEDAEVYLNGALAFTAKSWETGYFQAPISPGALAALVVGANVLAVHCHNTTAPQFIDVGLGRYRWNH